MRKQHIIISTFFALIFALIGCGDSTSVDDSFNGLGIVLERTGDEDIEITQGRFADSDDVGTIRFCYEGEGCEEGDSGSRQSWGGPERHTVEFSSTGKEAVGVIVEFQVSEGEGVADVVVGESYESEDGFPQFDEGEVVESSESFTEGDIVSFSYGETTQ